MDAKRLSEIRAKAEVATDVSFLLDVIASMEEEAKGRIPLPVGCGHFDPSYFVAVHKNRIERLEKALAFVSDLAGIDFSDRARAEIDQLCWGAPCAGCGCAETLCCCDCGDDPANGRMS